MPLDPKDFPTRRSTEMIADEFEATIREMLEADTPEAASALMRKWLGERFSDREPSPLQATLHKYEPGHKNVPPLVVHTTPEGHEYTRSELRGGKHAPSPTRPGDLRPDPAAPITMVTMSSSSPSDPIAKLATAVLSDPEVDAAFKPVPPDGAPAGHLVFRVGETVWLRGGGVERPELLVEVVDITSEHLLVRPVRR